MRVAILHYHLKPGGVTRVIENTVQALNQAGIESLVFCSEPPSADAYRFDNARAVPNLAYRDGFDPSKAETLKQDLENGCRKVWDSLPDLWHVHNHSLAKNLEVPVVVSQWAREGQKLLLQIHDFAEDGRPENYKALLVKLAGRDPRQLAGILYPTGSHVSYALINGRDRSFLNKAGVAMEQCHLLPNPIRLEIDREARVESTAFLGKRLYLYPTRSIRRKNVGELLLWAAAADEDEVFGATLAPANPTALPVYNRWVGLSETLQLPMHFGLGEKHSFDALLNTAYALTTTSIAEGFGLAYLEPYLIGAQLVGRDLPEITRDFSQFGIDLQGLYPRLDVPVAWLDLERVRKTVHEGLVKYYQSYRQTFKKSMTGVAMDEMISGDLVDFGKLDESMQKTVIELVAGNPRLKLDFAPEKLDRLLPETALKDNREKILTHFNTEAYGKQLIGIYRSLLEAPTSRVEFLDAMAVLNCFLDPRRFNLLRT